MTKIVLITGTSSGIGACLASALVDRGWMVIGLARRAADIQHPSYQHYRVDLSDLDALAAFFEDTLRDSLSDEQWQRVGLVNNAAIGSLGGLEQALPRELATVLAANTVAPMYLMASVARVAPSSAALRIINLSSGAGVRGFPGLGAYGGSKAALRLAGMVLAAELDSVERPAGRHPNFGILSYSPGPVDTEMQARARTTTVPWNKLFLHFAETGRLMPPSEVIGPIIEFLTTDDADPFSEAKPVV